MAFTQRLLHPGHSQTLALGILVLVQGLGMVALVATLGTRLNEVLSSVGKPPEPFGLHAALVFFLGPIWFPIALARLQVHVNAAIA